MDEQNFKLGAPGAIVLGAVIVAAAIIYTNYDSIKPEDQDALLPDNRAVEATIDDDAVWGDENAPVTIIEFSDYQCPFCRVFWEESLPTIEKDYIDTGKVKFVYRDFPLSSHAMALPYAEAAECSGDQGKYWDMHDKIFEEQAELGRGTITQITLEDLADWSAELDLDLEAFDECMASGKHRDEVLKDLDDGSMAGVQGTPSFFINGKIIRGALPLEAFIEAIESELGE